MDLRCVLSRPLHPHQQSNANISGCYLNQSMAKEIRLELTILFQFCAAPRMDPESISKRKR